MNGNDKNVNYKFKIVIEEVLEQNAKKMKKFVVNQSNILKFVFVVIQLAKLVVRIIIVQLVQ